MEKEIKKRKKYGQREWKTLKMQIRKTGIKEEGKRREGREREINRWKEAKTEGSSDCCNDCTEIVRSGFQLDLIQLQSANNLQASVPTPTERQTPISKS